jgi:hypothetical protein
MFHTNRRCALTRHKQKPNTQQEGDHMNTFGRRVSTTALAATMVIGALVPSMAGPLPANSAAIKSQGSVAIEQARWVGHRGWGPGLVFGGIAAGLAGAAIADGVYGPYAYGYGPYAYGYDAPDPYVYYRGGPYWGYRHYWREW